METKKIAINDLEIFDSITLNTLRPFLSNELNKELDENIKWLEADTITFYSYNFRQMLSKEEVEMSGVTEMDEDCQMDILVTFNTTHIRANRAEDEWLKERARKEMTTKELLANLFSPKSEGWTDLEFEKMDLYEIGRDEEFRWIVQDAERVEELAQAYITYVNKQVENDGSHVEIRYAPFRFDRN